MSKKKPTKKIRYKVTCVSGLVYYVYATDLLQATQNFNKSRPTTNTKGEPIDTALGTIEEDPNQGKLKTTLFEGRNVF